MCLVFPGQKLANLEWNENACYVISESAPKKNVTKSWTQTKKKSRLRVIFPLPGHLNLNLLPRNHSTRDLSTVSSYRPANQSYTSKLSFFYSKINKHGAKFVNNYIFNNKTNFFLTRGGGEIKNNSMSAAFIYYIVLILLLIYIFFFIGSILSSREN